LGDFSPIRLLLEAHYDFTDYLNGSILGYFLFNQYILHFHLKKQFKNTVCCRYFKVSKVVGWDCFRLSNLHFLAWQLFWLLLKKLAEFSPIFGHPE
jgi:hypothetical protein